MMHLLEFDKIKEIRNEMLNSHKELGNEKVFSFHHANQDTLCSVTCLYKED